MIPIINALKNLARYASIIFAFLSAGSVHADFVYVWSYDANGTIQRFDTNGGGITFSNTFSGWNGPVGLALDNVGNLYAGCPGSSQITRFTSDGYVFQVSHYVDSVSGLAFDSTGKLFITVPNYIELAATVYLPSLGYYYGLYYTQSHLNNPVCLAFDDADNIYVANVGGNSIEKFDYNLTDLGAFASGTNGITGLNQPWGIAFNASSNLFIANSGNDKILKITPAGSKSVYATSTSGLNAPHGLAFDSAGNLYVANYGGGNILKFSTSGTVSTFASGLNYPTSIAIFPGLKVWSAVPLKLNNPTKLSDGSLQFSLTASAGLTFAVLATTNISQALSNWPVVGTTIEVSPGSYQFTDTQVTNSTESFYRLRSQ